MYFSDYKQNGNEIILYNKSFRSDFPDDVFDMNFILSDQSFDAVQLQSKNKYKRGSACLFTLNEKKLVLRHYYRGGLVSKFINDLYIWQGKRKARSISEYHMLSEMRDMNLPVPLPVAAHARKIGFLYTADLITEFISNSQTLSSILESEKISNVIWEKIGFIIKLFHNKNCNHVDLNAYNILIDSRECIYLIDFDKSKIEKYSGVWKENNLNRLKRSLEKLASLSESFNYNYEDFKSLLVGYNKI